MPRYKVTLAYDGSGFSGYQVQPHQRTVQSELEAALGKMHKGEFVRITASGRTDTGVHAVGQVIHFDSPLQIPNDKFKRALQRMTPFDISIRSVEQVTEDFHARYGTIGKEYRYVIKNNLEYDPFSRNFALYYPYKLSIDKMREASQILIGEHDFTSFCSARTQQDSKIRTIYAIRFIEEGDTITICYQGDGFLYNMVRILTGALLDIGQGRMLPEKLEEALLAKDRTKLPSVTAPAQGLYLFKVAYK